MNAKGNGAPPPLFDGMPKPQETQPNQAHPGEEAPAFQVVDRRVSQMTEEELDDLGTTAAEPSSSAPSYVEQLEQQLSRAQERLTELQTQLRSELADEVESTRRRLEREAEQQARRQRMEMAEPMLEVLEALERSISVGARPAGGAPERSGDAVLEGVELVRQLMLRKLGELGLERIETVGQRFDPTLHEAIGLVTVDDASQDGVVVSEVTPGFSLAGQVMRAPRVQVGRLVS